MFEIGKTYSFDRATNGFTPSREGGKLIFIINEDGEAVGRSTPFDFQLNELPDKIECIFRGEGKFEQTQSSVLTKVYSVGEIYTFKVWRAGGVQGLTLRDEANGLTHTNMRIPGTGGVKRFDEIDCKVTAVSDHELQMIYDGAKRHIAGMYTLKSITENERLRDKPWIRVARMMSGWEVLTEARQASERGDGAWVAIAFQAILRLMPQWISEAPKRRLAWVPRLDSVIRTVVESPAYATAFNYNKLRLRAQRHELARGLEQLDYIGRAAALVAHPEKAEDMIEHTLETMRQTGWIFEPNQRMGVLMQVLAMAPGLGHSHTSEVFEIIRTRRGNRDFMLIFGDAFKIMLKTYIESERTAPDQLDRNSLRELAEAIAIELLLVADTDFELWDTHRGTLYTIAALLTGHSSEAPIRKAAITYCGLNDAPLEFGWEDLGDINRVCYRLLATGRDRIAEGVEAVFEGENIRMVAAGKTICLQPAGGDAPLRTALSGTLTSDLSFAIQLPDKLKEKNVGEQRINLAHQRLLWEKVCSIMKESTSGTYIPRLVEKELQPGDTIDIIVIGPSATERFEYDCRSVDGRYMGIIAIRDVVPYPVSTLSHIYWYRGDNGPLRLPATAVEQTPDGLWRFSMRRFIMDLNARDGRQDMAEGNKLLAKVTDTSGSQYKATTEYGYGILLSKRDLRLSINDLVEVRVDSVNFRPEDLKLYINCTWLRTVIDADDDNYLAAMVEMPSWEYGAEALRGLMLDNFESIDDEEVAPLQAEADLPELEVSYVNPEAVQNLAFLLENCAALQRSDLKKSYTLLWLARLLAEMADDKGRSDALEIQLRLLEALSRFASDGMMDLEPVRQLIERGRRMQASSALLRSRLKEVAVLAGMDNKLFLARTMEWAQKGADEHIHKLIQLVLAYNTLEGLGTPEIRNAIRSRINSLLSLPAIVSKQRRLNVSEDLYHEFKTSAIFPADNHMKPDERQQSFVIARTIASFLNTEGGTIYLGVDNGGNLRGLDNDFRYLNHSAPGYDIREIQDKYNLYLQKAIRYFLGTTIDGLPLVPDFIDIQHEEVEGLWICHINVRPFPRAVLTKPDGKLFLRRIGETVEQPDPAEKRLFIERRNERGYR